MAWLHVTSSGSEAEREILRSGAPQAMQTKAKGHKKEAIKVCAGLLTKS